MSERRRTSPPRLNKAHREQLEVLRPIFEAAGLKTELVIGGKHIALVVEGRHKIPMAGSPKTALPLDAIRQNARRLIARIKSETA